MPSLVKSYEKGDRVMVHSIIKRKSMLSLGAGVQTIEMDEYPEEVNIEWTRFVGRVINGDATLIELGVKLAKSEYIVRAAKVTNVGTAITSVGPGCATGGYKPFARFTGTAAGETLEFFAYGVICED